MRSSRFDEPESRLDEPATITEGQLRWLRWQSAAAPFALVIALAAVAALVWGNKQMTVMKAQDLAARQALIDTLNTKMAPVLAQSDPAKIEALTKAMATGTLTDAQDKMDQALATVTALRRSVDANAARIEGVQGKVLQMISAQEATADAIRKNAAAIVQVDSTSARRVRMLKSDLSADVGVLEHQKLEPVQKTPNM
jgi:hypothetical protein